MMQPSSSVLSYGTDLVSLLLYVFAADNGVVLLATRGKGGCGMMHRTLLLIPLAGAAVAAIVGCEPPHTVIREGNNRLLSTQSETSKIQAVDSDSRDPKPFFSNNRLAGGWSSEAREIESHLGIGP
jgi:hypothetical protein